MTEPSDADENSLAGKTGPAFGAFLFRAIVFTVSTTVLTAILFGGCFAYFWWTGAENLPAGWLIILITGAACAIGIDIAETAIWSLSRRPRK